MRPDDYTNYGLAQELKRQPNYSPKVVAEVVRRLLEAPYQTTLAATQPQPAAPQGDGEDEPGGEIAFALSVLEENHQWHHDYDDHGGYPASSLEASNVRAIAVLKSLAPPAGSACSPATEWR